MDVLVIVMRWVHVMSAILAIGGAFFMRVILPLGLAQADAASREAVMLRCRKAFKMVIHVCVTLLILSGAFNTWRNWGDYKLNSALMHAFWGTHLILGLAAIILSIILLAGPTPPRWAKAGAAASLVILFLVVALGSTLKYTRDREIKSRMTPVSIPAKP